MTDPAPGPPESAPQTPPAAAPAAANAAAEATKGAPPPNPADPAEEAAAAAAAANAPPPAPAAAAAADPSDDDEAPAASVPPPTSDDAADVFVRQTLACLEAEAREEEVRLQQAVGGKAGGCYSARIVDAVRGPSGSTVLTLEGRRRSGGGGGPKASDVVPRGIPVVVEVPQMEKEKGGGGGAERSEARGVSCTVGDEGLTVSVDSDSFDPEWLDRVATVVPLRTDVTAKAMRAALVGGGHGFGGREGDTPPLAQWRRRSEAQKRVVALAYGEAEARAVEEQEGQGEQEEQEEVGGPPSSALRFHAQLNPSQQAAVVRCCAEDAAEPVRLILGPPGTGKTETVCEAIRQLVLRRRKRVLVGTPSNVAADNIVERLCVRGGGGAAAAPKGLRVVRVGHGARLSAALQPFSLDARMAQSDAAKVSDAARSDLQKLRRKMKGCKDREAKRRIYAEMRALNRDVREQERRRSVEVLGEANVVVGTLVNATQYAIRRQSFDVVVVDEACQALEAAAWVVAAKADRLVLAGDPHQLPPTVLSNEPLLRTSLFERLHARHGARLTSLLDTQYRMHDTICAWSSSEFYEGRVASHGSVAGHLLCELSGVEETDETSEPAVFTDTAHDGMPEEEDAQGSRWNPGEAHLAATHVAALLAAGVRATDVAVITPYAAQVRVLAPLLPEGVEVGTVDSYQGREKEAVVLSLVRSNPAGDVGFLADARRLNVAVTRARRHVAVIGDGRCIGRDPFLGRLVEYLEENALLVMPCD